MPEFTDVDPGNLHLPPSLAHGANPGKLARQIAKHGKSLDGMPPLQVIRGKDGHLRMNDGVTRACEGPDQVCWCPSKSSKMCRDSM